MANDKTNAGTPKQGEKAERMAKWNKELTDRHSHLDENGNRIWEQSWSSKRVYNQVARQEKFYEQEQSIIDKNCKRDKDGNQILNEKGIPVLNDGVSWKQIYSRTQKAVEVSDLMGKGMTHDEAIDAVNEKYTHKGAETQITDDGHVKESPEDIPSAIETIKDNTEKIQAQPNLDTAQMVGKAKDVQERS